MSSPPGPTLETRNGLLVKTFGCQMNEYDSEKMLVVLSDSFREVNTVNEAKLVIINTCSIREKGAHKLRSLLGRLAINKQQDPELIVGVAGCVAQQDGAAIIKRHAVVDFVVGTHNLSLIPSLVEAVKSGRGKQVAVDYRDEWETLPDDLTTPAPVRAYVSIQRGCNKNCAFCVVPNTRGPEVSRSAEEIEREVRLKVRLGAREILLLGQTVNSYGKDLPARLSFEKLIERLSLIPDLKRIRFTSPHPQEVRDDFIALYANIKQLCPYIHLPLQSGSDRILRLMNRNYRIKRYLEIVDALRRSCPEIAISSDIIVGFATETAEDFEQTLMILRKVRYNSVFSFKYSKRPGTLAEGAFSPSEEVPDSLATERLYELQNLQNSLSLQLNQEKLFSTMEVLVEGPGKKILSSMWGRNLQNVRVDVSGGKPKIGELVQVRAESCGPASFCGTVIDGV